MESDIRYKKCVFNAEPLSNIKNKFLIEVTLAELIEKIHLLSVA